MRLLSPRLVALLCAPPLTLGLSACAQTVSTSGLKGEAKAAAETIKNLQSDVTAGEQKKICKNDLARAVVARLSSFPGGCEAAVKEQLSEIDSVELTVESVGLGGTASARTATAHVKSVYSGKKKVTTMTLVKEGGKWKVASF
ncbi:MAG: hypothetical protein QOF54_2138 [Solirubrobacteraceae bacterium]|jgi:hypothetical protein|nr:hypothetical protein [Solirubrobacterales bacterium]MEA2209661.1 hypothetical protein [Solirubrobacteraceae bacterium]